MSSARRLCGERGSASSFCTMEEPSDLLKAIQDHFSPASPKYPASEANGVVHKFNKLSLEDKQAILDFLRSL